VLERVKINSSSNNAGRTRDAGVRIEGNRRRQPLRQISTLSNGELGLRGNFHDGKLFIKTQPREYVFINNMTLSPSSVHPVFFFFSGKYLLSLALDKERGRDNFCERRPFYFTSSYLFSFISLRLLVSSTTS